MFSMTLANTAHGDAYTFADFPACAQPGFANMQFMQLETVTVRSLRLPARGEMLWHAMVWNV